MLSFSLVSQPKESLNVVWISCEDMGPLLGSYGTPNIKTPNLDKLASEGVRYTNAYATVGVCSPSRFSIMTGMYAAGIGAHNMRTGNFHNYKTPEQESYKTYIKVRDKTGRNVPEYSVVPPPHVKCFTEYLRANGYYCANNFKCDYQFKTPFTAWDEVSGAATYKKAPKGKPFFYVRNFMVTHESRIWMREDKPLTVPPNKVLVPDYYPDIPIVRENIARKYSNIEEMDRQVGELLDELKAANLMNRTIIFFWSDHGGNLLRQKRAVGNSGLHVPLIVRYPNKKDAGKVEHRMVSLMDLGATTLSLLGIQPPAYFDGKAFAGKYETAPRDLIYGTADRFDEHTDMQRSVLDGRYVYIKNFMPQLPLIYRNAYREQIPMNARLIEMHRNKELKGDAAYMFMHTKPKEELYDLKNDPYEVHNIANDSSQRERLSYFRQKLAAWQLGIGDKGFIPEHDLIEMFWPGMLQPTTAAVNFKKQKNGKIALHCDTEGASIGYQMGEAVGGDHWTLYTKPFKKSKKQKLVARAVRIGYKTSAIRSDN